MRHQSSAKQREQRTRRRLAADLIDQRGPWCQAGTERCTGRAVDMHEIRRRSQGGDPTDPTNVLLVCRACHDWIGAHPSAAVDRGLAAWGWM